MSMKSPATGIRSKGNRNSTISKLTQTNNEIISTQNSLTSHGTETGLVDNLNELSLFDLDLKFSAQTMIH